MSLSTQLTRGTLALPMLALFGVLALVAGRSAEAETLPVAPTLSVEAHADNAATCCPSTRPQMLLAQAPGDLGPIAQRQNASCRA
jgi:hypothetical protein